MNMSDFDAYVQRLQNLTPFTILHPTQDKDDVVDWYPVTQQAVLPELIINHLNIPAQIDLCPAQIQTWGRYKSIAQRAVDICQRRYRVWRDKYRLKALETAERSGEKKPTKSPTKISKTLSAKQGDAFLDKDARERSPYLTALNL